MAQEVITLDEPPITDEAHVPIAESHAAHKPFVPASKFSATLYYVGRYGLSGAKRK